MGRGQGDCYPAVLSTINHIGLSSGKDSTALWGWAINDSGYPPESIYGTFCDTQNEYEEVYEQIRTLDAYGQRHGLRPILTLQSEGFLALAIRKRRFPHSQARFCTEILKILPTLYYFQELWLEGHEIIAHSGVRADESTERSLLEEWGTAGMLKCPERRPLLKWKIADVWEAHRRYGLPINGLYHTGRKRVGCKLCCMSNKEDVRITAKTRPWVIGEIRGWEKQVGANNATCQVATFFPAKTIPDRMCSATYVNRKGESSRVPTIDDVVRWAFSLRGGEQQGFDFMFERDDSHLPCQSGYCE